MKPLLILLLILTALIAVLFWRIALALELPDGGTLFLTCKTIEELKVFEKCIGMWTPAY
jgi:hypothetical protein